MFCWFHETLAALDIRKELNVNDVPAYIFYQQNLVGLTSVTRGVAVLYLNFYIY